MEQGYNPNTVHAVHDELINKIVSLMEDNLKLITKLKHVTEALATYNMLYPTDMTRGIIKESEELINQIENSYDEKGN